MEKRIGIIGAGVAGLHLGLYLRQHDISATIITDRTAEQIARGRLPNTAAHFALTIDREKMLASITGPTHNSTIPVITTASAAARHASNFVAPSRGRAAQSTIASTCRN